MAIKGRLRGNRDALDAGISAKIISVEGTTHGTISSNLGLPNDRPTQEMFGFLSVALKK
jgi:hypothetical protein